MELGSRFPLLTQRQAPPLSGACLGMDGQGGEQPAQLPQCSMPTMPNTSFPRTRFLSCGTARCARPGIHPVTPSSLQCPQSRMGWYTWALWIPRIRRVPVGSLTYLVLRPPHASEVEPHLVRELG